MPRQLKYPPGEWARITRERREARELAVIKLVSIGYTDKEIAEELHYSVETVKEMLRDMYERLEVRNRAHMVTVAFRRGWLT